MARDADLENLVVSLAERGWSMRRIARELQMSRNTARRVMARVTRARQEGHSALPPARGRRASVLDAHADTIAELLDRYPDISAVRLHEELSTRGFHGGYTIVKQELRRRRPLPKKEPVQRFETGPGAQGQQDWSPYTIDFTETGEQQVQCFSFILGFSRRQFIHFTERQDFYALIRQHVATGDHYGGMPEEVLYDNQATIVLRREAGRPIYQPAFLAFATHYGFRPHALQPRTPEQKGKIERPFQYVEGNCLNARTFRNLAHLNEHAAWWMANVSDKHKHDTTGERPIDRFVREVDHLKPLPARPYDTAEVGYRVVTDSGFVSWQGTPYAVPWAHVLDLVVVRATDTEVIVHGDDLRIIARHARMPRGHVDPVGETDYHPPRRVRHDVDALVARIAELGDAGVAFGVGVCQGQRTRGHHLAEVLALRERYDADDLVVALERAVRYRAFDARVVARILETSATPRVLPDTLEAAAHRRLREDIPGHHVTARPMQAYADAIRGHDPTTEEGDG